MSSAGRASARLEADKNRLLSVIREYRSVKGPVMFAPRHAAIVILSALVLAGCQAETAPAERPPRPVKVESVIFADDAVSRDFVGVIAPRTETDLAFRVGGKVVARPVGVGDHVRAG